MIDKAALRTRSRKRRDTADSLPIPAWPGFTERLSRGLMIAAYHPVGSEADPAPLVAVAAGCRIALPHVVDRTTPLRFLAFDDPHALEPGPFGLRQPAATAAEVVPDIILTPLLAFDRRGNRLGQGAGHYDRAFAVHPTAWRVGVALSVQEVESLIADEWDVPLHAIATDREWIVAV